MQLPVVSIVMPVLNEEKHLAEAVSAALAQDYLGQLEVVLAIGPSQDRTLEIAKALAQGDDRVHWVENPSGRTPEAMNAGIAQARGEVIVRCDGHALLPGNYVSLAVHALEETGAVNVGGVMDAQGETVFEKAVAWAMKSPFGVGAASFHVGGQPGPAETVYLGCFRAESLKEVGGYDPKFTRAQDWELNHRLIEAGGLIWFDPALKVTYRPRPSLVKLASQYRQYGQWRRKVMAEHPETVRRLSALRYFAPPLALVFFTFGILGGFLGAVAGTALVYLLAVPISYVVALSLLALSAVGSQGWKVSLRLPAVLATMHFSWGWGFLTSNLS